MAVKTQDQASLSKQASIEENPKKVEMRTINSQTSQIYFRSTISNQHNSNKNHPTFYYFLSNQ